MKRSPRDTGQLSQEQKTGLVYDYILGTPAKACADRIGVSVTTVNKKFHALSKRVCDENLALRADFLPHESDPVWSKLEMCTIHCSAKVEEQLTFVPEALQAGNKRLRRNLAFKKRSVSSKCEDCPFEQPIDFPEKLLTKMFMDKTLSTRWQTDVPFKYRYVRFALVCAVQMNLNDDRRVPHPFVRAMLESMNKTPL